MTQEKIVALDSNTLPQMETKWFIVKFSPDELNVYDRIYSFKKYIGHRELLNTDVHFIECFDKNTSPVPYEFLIKTNSKLYLDELNNQFTLTETSKPKDADFDLTP